MLRSYFILLAIQTIGTAILFWFTVPLFRQTLCTRASCSTNGKFDLVVIGDHVDAGGFLDSP